MKKHRYLDTDVYTFEQTTERLRLLQLERLRPLSYIRDENGKKPKCVINVSYFAQSYVLGRNQGDLKNDTHDQKGFWDVVFTADGNYHFGEFKSWDYQDKNNVLAGFSAATILIEGGDDCELWSMAICGKTKITSKNPQTAVAVLNSGKVVFIVSEDRNANDVGLNGYELRDFVRRYYPNVEFLCQCDGGGSSEMIVDGVIKNYLSDGKERPMWNGLAFIETDEVEIEPSEPEKGTDEEMKTLKVLDVSGHQPEIDYAKVKESGIDGVILRCGRTFWGQIKVAADETFEKHYNGFKAVGMPVGVYYYSAANTIEKVKEEAAFTLNVLKGKKLEFPVYFDVENVQRQKPLSTQALTDITKTFCEIVEKAGYYVGIYTGKNFANDELDMNQLKAYDFWVAQYASKCTFNGPYGMWQYTDKGQVNGIVCDEGKGVDLNHCYKDYPSIIKKAGLNGYGATEDVELEKVKTELALTKKSLEAKEIEIIKLEDLLATAQDKIVKAANILK